jgi:DNA end-binding protein Ku
MFYADEIRDQDEAVAPGKVTVAKREVDLAKHLIAALTAEWDPAKFHDTYRDRVMDLIRRKAKGEEIAVEERPPEEAPVVDLMEALKASLGARRPANDHPAPRRRARAAGHGKRRKSA